MMEEAANDLDSEIFEHRQALVGPRKVICVRPVGSHAFPEDRIADRFDAEARDQGDIGGTGTVSGLHHLIAPAIADANDRALGAGPQFRRNRGRAFG